MAGNDKAPSSSTYGGIQSPSYGNLLPPTSQEGGQLDLRPWQYLAIIARRWKILVLVPAAAVGFVLYYNTRKIPLYTAQVVLQRLLKLSPLQSIADDRGGDYASQQEVLSQLEILRSRAVLADAVDSAALRAGLPAHGEKRSVIFSFLSVDPRAPLVRYTISGLGRDSVAVGESGRAVAWGRLSDTLSFNGVRFALNDAARKNFPIILGIDDRERAIEALRNQIKPEQVRGTSLFRVTLKDRDPVLAAQILNALAFSYKHNVALQARQEATRRRQFLSDQLASVADSLSLAKIAMENYQQTSQTIDPTSEGQAASVALRRAEDDLRTLQFQEGLLQNLIATVEKGEASDRGLQRMVSVVRDLVPSSNELYTHLRDLETERSRLTTSRSGLTAQARSVQAVDSLIASTRGDLKGVTADALQLMRAKRQSAEQEVRDLRAKVSSIPMRATTFNTLQQRVDAIQKTYDVLSDKHYEAQLAEAVEAGDVEIVDRARVPLAPDGSNLSRNLMLALIGGLFLSLAIIATFEYLDTTIRTNEDATRETGLEILGVIPDFGKLDRSSSRSGLEAYRKLKTTLRFVRTGRLKVLMVTSAAPSEGKSVTAANLAAALAKEGTLVLLLDADMHRPTVHHLFSLERSPGLSDVLVGEAQLEKACVQRDDSLYVLPAGTFAPQPAELYSSGVFEDLVAELRHRFDYVILDGPPVLAVADSAIISPLTDGVLFVVLAESTDSQALAQAVTQLRRVNTDLLGLVMNRVPVGWRAYGSYYGYYEYSKYYADAGVGGKRDRLIVRGKDDDEKKVKTPKKKSGKLAVSEAT